METVTISPKFQVVIPKAIRTRLGLRAGQKIQAIVYQDRIELVPVRPARQLGVSRGESTRRCLARGIGYERRRFVGLA